MLNLTDKKNCCGCSSCAQACPRHCIKMKEDVEGFLYPHIEQAVCIDCGKCNRVCPVENAANVDVAASAPGAYVAYAKDDVTRESSSSGGVFSVLAEAVLDKGGVVFGCAFDDVYMAHHIAVKSKEELAALRGSKYLQSRIEKTYTEAERYLKGGRAVLFSGTACQIAGLKCFLGKNYENLLTVDVLCHGVPSPLVWARYLEERKQLQGAAVSHISFRDKRQGWHRFSLQIQFADHTECRELHGSDPYMKLFLSDICLRPSCYACRFKVMDRPSDITIGDAWGVERHSPEMDDDRGTSVVLTHTDKGNAWWNRVCGAFMAKKVPLDTALPPNADSRKSVAPHKNRSRFFDRLGKEASTEELLKLTKKSPAARIKGRLRAWARKLFR